MRLSCRTMRLCYHSFCSWRPRFRITFGVLTFLVMFWAVTEIYVLKSVLLQRLAINSFGDSSLLKRRDIVLDPVILGPVVEELSLRDDINKTAPSLVTCGLCDNMTAIPTPLKSINETFEWQNVEQESEPRNLVFSAFYKVMGLSRVIHVIGLRKDYSARSSSTLFCQVWTVSNENKEEMRWVRAEVDIVVENHSRRYTATFYTCHILDKTRVPYAVSVVTDPCQTPVNLLKVHPAPNNLDHSTKINSQSNMDVGTKDNTNSFIQSVLNMFPGNEVPEVPEVPEVSEPKVNFTVCVTPFNFNFNSINQLIEIIETNRMFGAQRFIFYNYSTGSDIIDYLESYIKDELVRVIPWHLPMRVDVLLSSKLEPEVHYFGQLAALNDCLYRSALNSLFAVFTDLDEILVPRRHKNWSDLLDDVSKKWVEQHAGGFKFPGQYVVKSTFFRNDFGNDNLTADDEVIQKLSLKTLLTTNREGNIFPWYSRSKYIVWTKMVHMAGVHGVGRSVDDQKVDSVLVGEDDALIHHYRNTMWPDDPRNPPQRVLDRRMHEFKDEIVSRVSAGHRKCYNLKLFHPSL